MEPRKSTWAEYLAPMCMATVDLLQPSGRPQAFDGEDRDDAVGISEGSDMSGAMGVAADTTADLVLWCWSFLDTALPCPSIRIRGYYDPNFHLPSAALTLHLYVVVLHRDGEIVTPAALHTAEKISQPIHGRRARTGQQICAFRTKVWNSFKTSICRR